MARVNSLNAFWPAYWRSTTRSTQPEAVIFTGGTNTGCGAATSYVGPFDGPADTTAYFDPGFFQDLVNRFGSSGGPLAQVHVVAHEFGHRSSRTSSATWTGRSRIPRAPVPGPSGRQLQADCYAGRGLTMYRRSRYPKTGQPYLEPFMDKDIQDALSAASAVGDDRIQKAATGRVAPEAWNHGSSAQRQKWFDQGYTTGDINKCDTFAVATP